MIRILLVDDHNVVRAGLQQVLDRTEDLSVVGTAADGGEAVLEAARLEPDLILMDISMPEVDGVEATRQILARQPQARVVMLTSFSNHERVMGALDAGAVGYLLKDSEPSELLRGVRAAARDESPLDPKVARTVLQARSAKRLAPQLSAREYETLLLVGDGLGNKQIALRLGISEKTVKAHLTNIFQRLGVTRRAEAALWVRDHGAQAGATDSPGTPAPTSPSRARGAGDS